MLLPDNPGLLDSFISLSAFAVADIPKAIAPSIALPALIKSLRCILTFSIGQFEKERMGMIFSL
ncbi:hypothetical protein [Klebsiella pneumoniae IS22]|nr:hypothetical protein [Klebsiella pneumoniae IS22]CDK74054.1 hypothetical protein [Klebsiella pneumoniae IS22]